MGLQALTRVFTALVRLGFFDLKSEVAYKRFPPQMIDSTPHRQLARHAASHVMVLLKNKGNILPISQTRDEIQPGIAVASGNGGEQEKQQKKKVAIIGPNADNIYALKGDYTGPTSAFNITPRAAAIVEFGEERVAYAPGCADTDCESDAGFDAAVGNATGAGLIVAVLGIQGDGPSANEIEGHDRQSVMLPGKQEELLARLAGLDAPLIVVLMNGGALSSPAADAHADAVIEAFYPGQFGGFGLFDIITGRVNPGARMPYTVPRDDSQIPPIADYSYRPSPENGGRGRTYKFINVTSQAPLYPFGFGMSFTTWRYSNIVIAGAGAGAGDDVGNPTISLCEDANVTVTVENMGAVAGSEVIQLYLTNNDAVHPAPRWALAGFERVDVAAGTAVTVTIPVAALARSEVGPPDYQPHLVGSNYTVWVGGGQPGQAPNRTTSNIEQGAFRTVGTGRALTAC